MYLIENTKGQNIRNLFSIFPFFVSYSNNLEGYFQSTRLKVLRKNTLLAAKNPRFSPQSSYVLLSSIQLKVDNIPGFARITKPSWFCQYERKQMVYILIWEGHDLREYLKSYTFEYFDSAGRLEKNKSDTFYQRLRTSAWSLFLELFSSIETQLRRS